jgi:hypothetical protein
VDGDLLGTRVLEHDHRPPRRATVLAVLAQRGPGGREDGHGELAPMGDGVLALRLAHLGEMVVVALRQGGDRSLERRLGEQVLR